MINGILGKKLGMTQVFQPDGSFVAVTAIEAGPCTITQVKTVAKDGYDSIQIGFDHAKRLKQPVAGHLGKLGNVKYMREVTVADPSKVEVGQKVDASIFAKGERVDITGTSKGRGFAGGVRRYHFHGGPKTHGQSDRQRAPGAIGSTTTPGRVLKGQRMAGHLGNAQITVRDIEIVEADPARNLLLIKGAVPGPERGLLIINKAGRRK
ncbi:MAG: 50S ribosomal protein L3 [Chloroflexi bacterium]|nr:50S ribosomal protein L3 [Chloroflexota bacterium]